MKKKIVKKLFAGVMAMTLCLGTTMMVSATESTNPAAGDVPQSRKVALTKVFDVPEAVTTPEATFTFNFEQISVGDSVTDDAKILPVNLTFSETDTKVDGRIAKESKDVLRNTTFPRAGVYVYRVSEATDTVEVAEGATMTYDDTTYILTVYVKNGENGPEVDTATVEKEGEGDDENRGKVNPAPTTDTESGDEGDENTDANPTTDGLDNKFAFVNAYNKNGGGVIDPVDPDPVDPDPESYGLKVSKTVAGDYGDRTRGFSFTLDLQLPASAQTAGITSVKGFICDADNKLVGDPIEFANGSTEFTLAHGQYLTFKSIPAGTTYTVTETGTPSYQGSAAITVNGESATGASAGMGENLVTEANAVGSDAGNSTDVTNTFDDQSTTPTGILVNNLPYIAIILVAVVGCVVIIASRKRRAN